MIQVRYFSLILLIFEYLVSALGVTILFTIICWLLILHLYNDDLDNRMNEWITINYDILKVNANVVDLFPNAVIVCDNQKVIFMN
jgi:hypothetical protein